MKSLFIAFITLASSFSFASGFQCSGMGYSAVLYNEVQPSLGTSNPAVLVLSFDEKGTVAKLTGPEIEKDFTPKAYKYAGATTLRENGGNAHVNFAVSKQLDASGKRYAEFTVTTTQYEFTVQLACDDYRKGDQE